MTPRPEPRNAILYVVWNDDGDVEADTNHETAMQRLTENYGGSQFRTLEIKLRLPLPLIQTVRIDATTHDDPEAEVEG